MPSPWNWLARLSLPYGVNRFPPGLLTDMPASVAVRWLAASSGHLGRRWLHATLVNSIEEALDAPLTAPLPPSEKIDRFHRPPRHRLQRMALRPSPATLKDPRLGRPHSSPASCPYCFSNPHSGHAAARRVHRRPMPDSVDRRLDRTQVPHQRLAAESRSSNTRACRHDSAARTCPTSHPARGPLCHLPSASTGRTPMVVHAATEEASKNGGYGCLSSASVPRNGGSGGPRDVILESVSHLHVH